MYSLILNLETNGFHAFHIGTSPLVRPHPNFTPSSLELLRSFYTEGMVDKRGYLVWLVQQIVACNLGQLGFVARLVDEYLEDMVDHRALMRPLVESCLSKLSEVTSMPFPVTSPLTKDSDSVEFSPA